jgi:diacylglycerol O-acyltransferase / wax synthase
MTVTTAQTAQTASRRGGRFRRLTPLDRMYLRSEERSWPGHFGGLVVVEGEPLLDGSGQLRLDEIRDRLARRLARVPELRGRLHFPGFLRGGPLWVDDERFDIRNHVLETTVDPRGEEAALLEAAARVYGHLLDRRRPLWELWFLTGLGRGRVGVLLKLHHCVADGSAVVEIMGSLFDIEPDSAEPVAGPWHREPVPGSWALLTDNLSGKARAVGRVLAVLAHPRRLSDEARVAAIVVRRSGGNLQAPRTSLNGPVAEAGRRIASLGLDLGEVKDAAHALGGTVNDVVLDLWSGGLRELLVSRGEPVAGLEPIASQAVSTREAADRSVGNKVGNTVVPLPVSEADPARRLAAIVRTTRRSKATERPAVIMSVLVAFAATPIGRYLVLHQRAVNVKVTNLIGPPVPVYLLGARVLDVLPITQLLGNIALSLCAFSYAGRLSLVVTADARRFPDLEALMAGMERDWGWLTAGPAAVPITALPLMPAAVAG